MKFNIKKKFLAAAVCLALSASSALAMPSGGSVQSGSIDLPHGGNLISGDIITASTNGVINWSDFSIDDGQSLTFALGGHTVLNRVTGEQMSKLLGKLDASDGNLMLSNPNGIFVGGGARIDAHNLMLTTLSFDNEAANIIFNDVDKIANFKNGNAAKGVEINGGTVSVAHALDVIGGTVTIADGVNITGAGSGSLPTDIHVLAANKADVSGGDAGLVSANATSANVINIGTDNNMTNLMALNNVGLYGGGININNTNIKSKNVDVFAFAVNNGSTITADTTNTVNVKNSGLDSDFDTFVVGNSVSINNGYIKASNGEIEIAAVKKYSEDAVPEANADNKVIISNDTIFDNNGKTMIYAGAAIINGNYYGIKGQQEINRSGNGDVYATILVDSTPSPSPSPAPTPTPVEELNKTDQNIANSETAAELVGNVLNSNISTEKKQQIVKVIMESSPVVADKTQEIKNQDAASQAGRITSPLENASNAGADSDNGADSAVSVEGNTSDNNESEE